MPTELQDALEATAREHKLVFGLIASATGEILATSGDLDAKAFRWLVGKSPQRWLCTEPSALRARYVWLRECEATDAGLLTQMTQQGDCFLAWMKPFGNALAVVGFQNAGLERNVLRLHEVCKRIDATLKRLIAAEGTR